MLLRRVIEHVKAQNWFAVGLDFLIVVIGVFVGLQVSNWNEARVASADEAKLLDRLIVDMGLLEEEFAGDLEDFELTASSTGYLLDVIRSDAMPDDEAALVKAIWAANFYYELPSVSPVFQEIVTGSGLSSLSNSVLRNALSRYGDFHERLLRDAMIAKPVILEPHLIYLKAVSWSSNAMDWDAPDTAIIGYDWETLKETEPELQAWLVYQTDSVRGVRQTLDEIRNIMALLESET